MSHNQHGFVRIDSEVPSRSVTTYAHKNPLIDGFWASCARNIRAGAVHGERVIAGAEPEKAAQVD